VGWKRFQTASNPLNILPAEGLRRLQLAIDALEKILLPSFILILIFHIHVLLRIQLRVHIHILKPSARPSTPFSIREYGEKINREAVVKPSVILRGRIQKVCSSVFTFAPAAL
jgi:hypothetical protein